MTLTAFRLHPALDPAYYVMGDTLAGVESWKALCYSANSGGEVGAMDAVGYVMISKIDDTIIPMARGDEHHRGYDTLFALSRKRQYKTLKPDDYVPVWPYGNNYIYDETEAPLLLNVVSKFLSYGGDDGILIGCNDLQGTIVTLSSFVASKGSVELAPGTVAPLGDVVLKAFGALATTLNAARGEVKTPADLAAALNPVRGGPRARKAAAAFREAHGLLKLLKRYAAQIRGTDCERFDEAAAELCKIAKVADLQRIEEIFFGMAGFKNRIHNAVRQAIKNRAAKKRAWEDDATIAVWGDLDLANDLLGRL